MGIFNRKLFRPRSETDNTVLVLEAAMDQLNDTTAKLDAYAENLREQIDRESDDEKA